MLRSVLAVALVACSAPSPPAPPGDRTIPITIASFAGLPRHDGKATDGQPRETYSLRDYAARLGATMRVTAVVGEAGPTPIALAAWRDLAKTPVVHATKRGGLKFRWANPDGSWDDTETKGVTALVVTAGE